jgi:Flp pilus assembly secretin CpaC
MLLRTVPVALAVLLSCAAQSYAQVAPFPDPAPIRLQRERDDMLASERNVRIDVAIALKGPKPVVKALTMVAADGRSAAGRAGIEIPVATGSNMIESFTYRPVNINVDATPTILASGRVLLRLKMNFQTVYLPTDSTAPRASFGSGTTDLNAVLFESGKPLTVTQATDGESGREYTVQVTATILK